MTLIVSLLKYAIIFVAKASQPRGFFLAIPLQFRTLPVQFCPDTSLLLNSNVN